MRILVIEDSHRLSSSLAANLAHEGYSVDAAYDGQEGQDLAELTPYDLIILDILLPKKDGLQVCRDLRSCRIHTPILLLTARDGVEDRVQGLDYEADDYLVKPLAMRELLAGLRALLRRQSPYTNGRLEIGDLVVDPVTHTVEREGRSINLTPKEFALLEFLLYHPNQVVTRELIEQHIWNYDFECESNVIDVYVRRLRRKIDAPFAVKLLTTVRGVGYRLQPPPERGRPMKRTAQHRIRVSLAHSVRTRLTLWYLAVMAFIIVVFGGSLYATQTFLNTDAAESRLETQLYQDSQRFAQTYKQALLDRQAPTGLHLTQSSQELVLLLRPDGSILDMRGPLAGSVIEPLRARAEQNAQMLDLTVPQNHSQGSGWWANDNDYRVLLTPVLNQNARVATLLGGLPRQYLIPFHAIWLFWRIVALLIAAIGGYCSAGTQRRPRRTITRTANEINATDLRR